MIYDRDLRHEIVKCQKRSKVAHKHLRWRILQRAAKLLTLDVWKTWLRLYKLYMAKKVRQEKENVFHRKKRKKKLYVFINAARNV